MNFKLFTVPMVLHIRWQFFSLSSRFGRTPCPSKCTWQRPCDTIVSIFAVNRLLCPFNGNQCTMTPLLLFKSTIKIIQWTSVGLKKPLMTSVTANLNQLIDWWLNWFQSGWTAVSNWVMVSFVKSALTSREMSHGCGISLPHRATLWFQRTESHTSNAVS